MSERRHRRLERLADTFLGVVVGVLLAAGFSYLAEQRQAHREMAETTMAEFQDLRQASRLVDDDLVSVYTTLEALKKGRLGIGNFTEPHSLWPYSKYLPVAAWKEQRGILARHLPRAAWLTISDAFSQIERLPELFRSLDESGAKKMPKNVARSLGELYTEICQARTLITPRALKRLSS